MTSLHSHRLQLVAVRTKDRFKNFTVEVSLKIVHFEHDIPVGYCNPVQLRNNIDDVRLGYLGVEISEQSTELFTKQLELCKKSIESNIQKRIDAANEYPILYFPDDFRDGVNILETKYEVSENKI